MQTSLAELGALLPLAMVALLLINDHLLKSSFHNAVTGKLSDIAICFLLPLLMSAALGMVVSWSTARRLWVGAAVTAVLFSALEMSDVAAAGFARAMAAILGVRRVVLTRDPTDLLALACVPLAIAYGRWRAGGRRSGSRGWASAAGALALISGSLALMADSPPAECDRWSAPVAFQVEGDCGANGPIVVEGNSYSRQLTITNAAALLPPLPSSGNLSIDQRYQGFSCPYTPEKGDWDITVGRCDFAGGDFAPINDAGTWIDAPAADASREDAIVDAGAPTKECPATYRKCHAALEGDQLWFTCIGADPNLTICRSRLTVLP